jgi:hypothetical protein
VSFLIKDEEAGDNEDILGAGDPAHNPDDDLVAADADLPQSKSRAEIERAEKARFLMVREDIGEDDSAMNTVD